MHHVLININNEYWSHWYEENYMKINADKSSVWFLNRLACSDHVSKMCINVGK